MSKFWYNTLKIMKIKNISQTKLADAIGKHKTTINNWIKYDRIPPADFAIKIADFLKTDLRFIVTNENANDEINELVFLKKNWNSDFILIDTVKNLLKLDQERLLMVNGYIQGKLNDSDTLNKNYISDNSYLMAAEEDDHPYNKKRNKKDS